MRIAPLVLAAGVAIVGASPAFANQCPSVMQKFDQEAQMKSSGAEANSKDMKTALSLRKEAGNLHDQGKHAESLDHLARASKLIGAPA